MKTNANRILEVWLQFKKEVKAHNENPYEIKGDNVEATAEQFFHWLEYGYFKR